MVLHRPQDGHKGYLSCGNPGTNNFDGHTSYSAQDFWKSATLVHNDGSYVTIKAQNLGPEENKNKYQFLAETMVLRKEVGSNHQNIYTTRNYLICDVTILSGIK
jgi:hypothetical protein